MKVSTLTTWPPPRPGLSDLCNLKYSRLNDKPPHLKKAKCLPPKFNFPVFHLYIRKNFDLFLDNRWAKDLTSSSLSLSLSLSDTHTHTCTSTCAELIHQTCLQNHRSPHSLSLSLSLLNLQTVSHSYLDIRSCLPSSSSLSTCLPTYIILYFYL